jgi:uncharacterized phage protein (TIGR01671 family)
MRKIKFRAFDNEHKEMIYKIPLGTVLFYEDFQMFLDNTTLMQFTGLKDCKGREIYEGDIVKVMNPYSNCWSTNGAEVIFSTEYVGGWVISAVGQNLNLGTRERYIEVIGNIHENPELMEREE